MFTMDDAPSFVHHNSRFLDATAFEAIFGCYDLFGALQEPAS